MKPMLGGYRSAVLETPPSDGLSPDLLISRSGQLATYYAPFEHVNTAARVVLVGITPGLFQAQKALEQLRAGLRSGLSDADALRQAKEVASFSEMSGSNNILLLAPDRQTRHGLAYVVTGSSGDTEPSASGRPRSWTPALRAAPACS